MHAVYIQVCPQVATGTHEEPTHYHGDKAIDQLSKHILLSVLHMALWLEKIRWLVAVLLGSSSVDTSK